VTEESGRRLDLLGRRGEHRFLGLDRDGFLAWGLRSCPGLARLLLGGHNHSTLVYRRLGLGRPLRLGLFGQIPAAAELHAQIIGHGHLEWTHGPHPLLAHGLEGDDQILAGDTQLLREIDDLDSCRHSPLTSSPCRSRPGRSE